MTKKEASDKQEKMVAKFLGWKQVTGSGSRPNSPGDIVGEEWMGECKTHTTSPHKISFKKSVWIKICDEANSRFKYPAYFTDDGSQDSSNTWVVFKRTQLPSNGDYKVYNLNENIGDSYSFSKLPKQAFSSESMHHIVFAFDFNTSSTDLGSKRKLYLTLLRNFRDIINLE